MKDQRCKFLNVIGEGIWIGGIKGRYACHIPICEKTDKLCNCLDYNECEIYGNDGV